MKAIILAGGLGTRLSEETNIRPKPMVEIGGRPILWHIMKIYSSHGINDFIVCCGYKGYVIKEYFSNYHLHASDVTFDMRTNTTTVHQNSSEPWSITLVDTGDLTQTGGRIKRIREFIKDDEAFCLTYGDGLGDINLTRLLEWHKKSNRLVTVTAVNPPSRFGSLHIDKNNIVLDFHEKPHSNDGGYINGGFFVVSPKALDYIEDDETSWEDSPLKRLSKENQLSAYIHNGFWQPMDTLREKMQLEELWANNNAPWKSW